MRRSVELAVLALLGAAVLAIAGTSGRGAPIAASATPGESGRPATDGALAGTGSQAPAPRPGGAAVPHDCAAGQYPRPAEARSLSDCIAASLHAGYLSRSGEWRHADLVRDFPRWTLTTAHPAASDAHGGRFLVIRVSPEGAGDYMKYAEDLEIPVGTRIAAESFSLGPKGGVVPGPLFLMEKVEYDRSPDTMGWHYMAVGPDGVPMGIDPWAECNDCHAGQFAHRGGLGYPAGAAQLRR